MESDDVHLVNTKKDMSGDPSGLAAVGQSRQSTLYQLRLHPRRHPLRWLAAAATLCVLGAIGYVFANGDLEWSVVPDYITSSVILEGFKNTVIISVLAMIVGLLLGVVFAVMRLSKNPVTSAVAWLYVWLFRGTPVLVQLLIWFNLALFFPSVGIPGIFHEQTVHVITPFVAALLGLGINEGAYLAEVIRGGILSVDPGQREAAAAFGLGGRRTLTKIILPQAMTAILPTVGNEAIGMLKMSSLATVISYSELLQSSQSIYFVNGRVVELLFVASFWYLVATSVTSVGQYYIERHFGKSQARQRSAIDRMLRTLARRLRGAQA